MSELDEAARKLDQAVERLEAASKRVGDGKPAGKAGSASLADTTASVAARLEEAILRIDRLLEE
ncbi:MAG TPA: hypothetical protein VGP48_08005 [Stellaceae bacterium]|jgi:hypothetical protein|nr:hypothetical protein [Stellaceae bacterium]